MRCSRSVSRRRFSQPRYRPSSPWRPTGQRQHWIATVNAWDVTVRGEYQRFAVRAQGAGPDGGGATVRYVRDGSAVRFDADGDGERERLGKSERVDFEASTTVVVVVPPGNPGVGDVDGDRDERSPGWPCPGVDDGRESCETDDETE